MQCYLLSVEGYFTHLSLYQEKNGECNEIFEIFDNHFDIIGIKQIIVVVVSFILPYKPIINYICIQFII